MRNALAGVATPLPAQVPLLERVDASDALQQAGAEQRHQNQIDAVQPSEDAAVSAADHGLAAAEHFAQNAVADSADSTQRTRAG